MTTRRTFLKTAVGTGIAGVAGGPVRAAAGPAPMPARFWSQSGGVIACELCPNACMLADGVTGTCRVRRNLNGRLVTLGYGDPCAAHVDPIEKKPLYHVTPGARAFSIAVAGCNMRCLNCQNYTISQVSPLETRNEDLPPQAVVEAAVKAGCTAIAYTYSEPTVWYEYMYDTAKLARAAGLKNLMITSGYINEKPMAELAAYMDAANIDVKGFDAEIYRKLNSGKLDAVLSTLTVAKKAGIWVEAGTLVVPEWTDKIDTIRRMCDWIARNLGSDTPMHFLRFQPMYKLEHLYPTPTSTLDQAKRAAIEAGLKYVYVGNVAEEDSSTYCPSCHKVVVERRGFLIGSVHIRKGACEYCGTRIAGIWNT